MAGAGAGLFTDLSPVYSNTTSTYLEGSHPEELVGFGYSRERRPNRGQLCLGAVVTEEGIPVARLLLPGRTADPAAFREAMVAQLKERLSRGNVKVLLQGAARRYVRAVEIEDRVRLKRRLRDEIPAEAMPALRALKMAPPKLVVKLS